MRDELKDRAISLLKEAWTQGYEAGVHATNVDCGVVWEERIDAIREEIAKLRDSWEMDCYHDEANALNTALKIIDKYCGGDNE